MNPRDLPLWVLLYITLGQAVIFKLLLGLLALIVRWDFKRCKILVETWTLPWIGALLGVTQVVTRGALFTQLQLHLLLFAILRQTLHLLIWCEFRDTQVETMVRTLVRVACNFIKWGRTRCWVLLKLKRRHCVLKIYYSLYCWGCSSIIIVIYDCLM